MNSRYYKPIEETQTKHLHALCRAAMDRGDLLEWCRLLARDEDTMRLYGVVHPGPTIWHRLEKYLVSHDYKPGD